MMWKNIKFVLAAKAFEHLRGIYFVEEPMKGRSRTSATRSICIGAEVALPVVANVCELRVHRRLDMIKLSGQP